MNAHCIFDPDRGGTFEDHHGFRPVEVGPSVLTDFGQGGVSFFITEPDDLEGGVGGNITTSIVVDGFARTTEETGSAVFFPEDQI